LGRCAKRESQYASGNIPASKLRAGDAREPAKSVLVKTFSQKRKKKEGKETTTTETENLQKKKKGKAERKNPSAPTQRAVHSILRETRRTKQSFEKRDPRQFAFDPTIRNDNYILFSLLFSSLSRTGGFSKRATYQREIPSVIIHSSDSFESVKEQWIKNERSEGLEVRGLRLA